MTELARNYRSRFGELDLVMDAAGTVVFVEVRQRRSQRYGGALASITPGKLQRLHATAAQFLAEFGLHRAPARFDAVLLDGAGHIDWLQNILQD